MPETCTHPESAIYAFNLFPLTDVGACRDCNALVHFTGEQWETLSPELFESLLYETVIQPGEDALGQVSVALMDAKAFLNAAESTGRHNPILIERRRQADLRDREVWATLRTKMKEINACNPK